MSIIWLVVLLSFDAHAGCPPVVDLAHDWVNATNGLKTPVPWAGGDPCRFVLRITNNDPTETATNLVLVDSLPTYQVAVSVASLPAGWTADLTQSGTGGALLGLFTAVELAPGASVTIMIDLTLTDTGCPRNYAWNTAWVTSSGYCAASPISSPEQKAGWLVFGERYMTFTVRDLTGATRRSFPRYAIGCPPASFRLDFGSGPGCVAPVADPAKPLTPDGD